MLPRKWFLFGYIILAFSTHADAAAGSRLPQPMRDALDSYAYSYANDLGWQYVDRSANVHGDYRRARFTLAFVVPQYNPDVTFTMDVEALVVRCGPGDYSVSTPGDESYCLPRWNYYHV